MCNKSMPKIIGSFLILICTANALEIEIVKPEEPSVTLPPITEAEKEQAFIEANEIIESKYELERELKKKGIVMTSSDPGFLNSATKVLPESCVKYSELGEIAVKASLELANRKKLSKHQCQHGLGSIQLDTSTFGQCYSRPSCNANDRFRTIDGSCNNLRNPNWGQAITPFIRNLDSDYGDGLETPRVASNGQSLPPARIVSLKATNSDRVPDDEHTHLLMQWGQFLDHDITLTPVVTSGDDVITCCVNGALRPANEIHPGCLPLQIANDDTFFSQFDVTCMEFIRSAAVTRRDCSLGPREQMNINSAYIDASNVYGSDDEKAEFLREHRGGLLRVFKDGSRDLLPQDEDPEEDCENEDGIPCFLAGDIRVNEQPILTVMHTLWMREHNRIATELSNINPSWNDERLYQEARRIVGAEMQHITYNEWLPIILGEEFSRRTGLMSSRRRRHYYSKYVDASISNEFATAAFRFGHNLIQGLLEGYDKSQQQDRSLALSEVFFKGEFLYESGSLDSILRGSTIQMCQKYDENIDSELTTKLYNGHNAFGLDLLGLNIQRGREHGLPSYTAFRQACRLRVPRSFNDLVPIMGRTNMQNLASTYDDVSDIDLFVGGFLEMNAEDAIVGETFRCILGNQFERLKVGDRYFYENVRDTRFTRDQIRELHQTSLARIICDNSDDIDRMQRNAFKISGHKYSCRDERHIRRVHLSRWRQF